jgi:hypothetical protein
VNRNAQPLSALKSAVFWQITLLPSYVVGLLLLILAASWESAEVGPYTSWFNNRLLAKAEQAHLVGSSADRVVKVLGQPDNIMRFWEVLDADGRPAIHAQFVTTYEYYPYPWLPFSKFQVHTTGGVVRTLERFDD